jgi:hypothetical protein
MLSVGCPVLGSIIVGDDQPSLMSDTLGAWARLEMGAFWAGVFWGVLASIALAVVGVGRVTMVLMGGAGCGWCKDGREAR